MKLTSWSMPLKPETRPSLDLVLALWLTSLLTALGIWALAELFDQSDERAERYGVSLAGTLAALAGEPLAREDRVHLAVITNRIQESPDVLGISVYTVDNQVMALSGVAQGGRDFTAPITMDNAVLGYARVSLGPDSQASPSIGFVLLGVLLTFAATGLAVVGLWSRRDTENGAMTPGADGETTSTKHPPRDFLLAVNLYNQLTLDTLQREQEFEHATQLANRVAGLYGGAVTILPGTGLLLRFANDGEDRGFQIVCAGLVLGRLLKDAETRGEYRMGLHLTTPVPSVQPNSNEAIADACLLSVLGKHQTLATSTDAYDQIQRPARLKIVPIRNPLLEELSTTSGCQLVSGVGTNHESLLDRQFEKLAGRG